MSYWVAQKSLTVVKNKKFPCLLILKKFFLQNNYKSPSEVSMSKYSQEERTLIVEW